MTDSLPGAEAARASDTAAEGPGLLLRSLREAQNLTLAQASTRLKYSVRQLEALEAQRWDILPTGVSLRGLVKNYGRYLGADTDAVLAMLESQVPSSRVPAMVAPSAALGGTDLALGAEAPPRAWGWPLVIVLLLGAAGFYALQRGWLPDSWLIFDWMRALKK